MKQIWLVEDDQTLAQNLKNYLERERYAVHILPTLASAKCCNIKPDLMILDWMLSDGQGLDFLKDMRARNDWTPVVMLTAKVDLVDKVLGLETGANDYLTKPFEPRELLARLRAHLRTPIENAREEKIHRYADVTIHMDSREVYFLDRLVEMTRKEFDLLALMMSQPTKVFSRDELLNRVWGFENFPTTRTVDTHVLQLRQKLRDDLVQTVRGVGYRLKIDNKLTTG